MKKLLLFLLPVLYTITSNAQQAQAGRVRIALAGFKCIRETVDDMLQRDGKGDEIFFQFYFTIANRAGATKFTYALRSDTYGDATGAFGNRISAGSCTDMFGGAKGGIRAGDNYTTNKVLGEYDLAAGDVLTVVPTLWEWDEGQGYESSFDATVTGAYSTINQKAANIGNTNLLGSNIDIPMFVLDGGLAFSLKAVNLLSDLGPKTRPIGLTLNGQYSPKAVLLTAPVMQTIANSNYGYGPGVIPVQYNEEALGNNRDHGNYIVLLKVSFVPSATTTSNPAPAPAPAPSQKTTPAPAPAPAPAPTPKTLNTTLPIAANRQINPALLNTIAGTWVGSSGTGANNSGTYAAYKLNNDGTMQLLGSNGAVLASGFFTFGNNQISGRYTYTNTNNTISFAGAMQGNQLSGTWGNGINTSGGGHFVMTKQK